MKLFHYPRKSIVSLLCSVLGYSMDSEVNIKQMEEDVFSVGFSVSSGVGQISLIVTVEKIQSCISEGPKKESLFTPHFIGDYPLDIIDGSAPICISCEERRAQYEFLGKYRTNWFERSDKYYLCKDCGMEGSRQVAQRFIEKYPEKVVSTSI